MIFDRIEKLIAYSNISSHFRDVITFLNSSSLAELECGNYDINDRGCFVILSEYLTKEIGECFIECHRKYIDIQYLIAGTENVGYCSILSCKCDDYDEQRDFQKIYSEVDILKLSEGHFMLFFPHDGHMPQIMAGNTPMKVRKAVFKVPVSEII